MTTALAPSVKFRKTIILVEFLNSMRDPRYAAPSRDPKEHKKPKRTQGTYSIGTLVPPSRCRSPSFAETLAINLWRKERDGRTDGQVNNRGFLKAPFVGRIFSHFEIVEVFGICSKMHELRWSEGNKGSVQLTAAAATKCSPRAATASWCAP